MSSRKRNLVSCLIAVALVFSLFCSVVVGVRIVKLSKFAMDRDVGLSLINELETKRPEDIDIDKWQNAVNWTKTAYLNIFFSVDSEASPDLAQFIIDSRMSLSSRGGVESVIWLWNRLSATGEYGREYASRFGDDFQRCLVVADGELNE